jgi:hypothetical protein
MPEHGNVGTFTPYSPEPRDGDDGTSLSSESDSESSFTCGSPKRRLQEMVRDSLNDVDSSSHVASYYLGADKSETQLQSQEEGSPSRIAWDWQSESTTLDDASVIRSEGDRYSKFSFTYVHSVSMGAQIPMMVTDKNDTHLQVAYFRGPKCRLKRIPFSGGSNFSSMS